MLISNKSLTDLKVLSRTEAHTVFRNLKCATNKQGAGLRHTGGHLELCRSRGQKCPKAKDLGLLWTSSSPVPTVPVLLLPDSTSKASPVYRRENLFLNALMVLAIIGAIFFTAGFLGSYGTELLATGAKWALLVLGPS